MNGFRVRIGVMTPTKNEAIEDRMRKEFMGDNDDYGSEDLE